MYLTEEHLSTHFVVHMIFCVRFFFKENKIIYLTPNTQMVLIYASRNIRRDAGLKQYQRSKVRVRSSRYAKIFSSYQLNISMCKNKLIRALCL